MVAYNTRDPRFDSLHQHFLFIYLPVHCTEKTKIKKARVQKRSFLKRMHSRLMMYKYNKYSKMGLAKKLNTCYVNGNCIYI